MGAQISQRMDLALWYGAMYGCYSNMSGGQREQLHQWERENTDGILSTSDWPGWDERIGHLRPKTLAIRAAKQNITSAIRMEVFARDGFKCKKCGSMDRLSVDYIVPESKGGAHVVENFQTLCKPCNSRKGARLDA